LVSHYCARKKEKSAEHDNTVSSQITQQTKCFKDANAHPLDKLERLCSLSCLISLLNSLQLCFSVLHYCWHQSTCNSIPSSHETPISLTLSPCKPSSLHPA
jgi:hypothetical protein